MGYTFGFYDMYVNFRKSFIWTNPLNVVFLVGDHSGTIHW